MARDMTPVLKRCRSLGMDSSCVRNRKQNSSTEFWRNLSVTILHAHRS